LDIGLKPVAGKAIQRPLEDAQADAVDPETLALFELEVRRAHEMGKHQKSGGLLALLCAHGCIRPGHAQQSVLNQITTTSLWGTCIRGKYDSRAYRWRCPRKGIMGWDFGLIVWRTWQKFSAAKGAAIKAVVLDETTGAPLDNGDVNRDIKIWLPKSSAYSFRSYQPTLLETRGASWEEAYPLGGWKASAMPAGSKVNAMPARYARDKASSAEITKVFHLELIRKILNEEPLHWGNVRARMGGADEKVIRDKAVEAIETAVVEEVTPPHLLPEQLKEKSMVVLSNMRFRTAAAARGGNREERRRRKTDKKKGETSGEGRRTTKASEEEALRWWRRPKGRIHIATDAAPLTGLCKRVAPPEKDLRITGKGVPEVGAGVCDQCFARLSKRAKKNLLQEGGVEPSGEEDGVSSGEDSDGGSGGG
jgi:hypothetical protein